MRTKIWSDQSVYDLLRKKDLGGHLPKAGRDMLKTREELNLNKYAITTLPDSISMLTSLQSLDLSHTQITALPDSIGQLTSLQTLNLCGTMITALPDSIGQLTSLHTLDLSRTRITALPDSIGQLTSLQTLDLSRTRITALPDSIGQLTSLQTIDLSRTRITALPASIGQLTGLQTLDLSTARITTLPGSIGQLTSLQTLNLSGTKITSLPYSIDQLRNLQTLNLFGTPITTLLSSIGKLTSLQTLNLGGAKILVLPETIGQLKNLQRLGLSVSRIITLPDSIGQLTSLRELYLIGTSITALPESICKLQNLVILDISGTPISSLPRSLIRSNLEIRDEKDKNNKEPSIYAINTKLPSVYFAGKEVLKKFFEETEKRGFGEAKVIFLGDGNAGKTYTINRIVNGDEKEPKLGQPYSLGQTHGVRPYDWPCPVGAWEEPFTIHFWDFGGQEMLHAMHRCFLTENTVYVIMVSTRASEHTRRIRYWLNSIYAYAKGTTVTVFVNVFGNHGAAKIEKKRLAAEFPEMELCFEILSVKDAENEEFHAKVTEQLIHHARAAEKECGLWPASYMRIKDRIKEAFLQFDQKGLQRGWFPAAEYREFCQQEGANNLKEQEDLLRYFTDLGVCFSSLGGREQRVQEDFRLIKPIWLTNALYAIIEECGAVQGKVQRSEIEDRLREEQTISRSEDYVRVAPELRYDPEDCKYVLRVAARYKLIYEAEENSEQVFFPAACTEERPDSVKKPEKPTFEVVCETDYPYLTETVVQRLMVDCLLDGYQLKNCWQGGFLLQTVGCSAMADIVRDDRSLRLDIWSDNTEQPVKALLLKLLKHLEAEAVAGKRPQTYVIRNGERFSVRRLRNAEENGLRQVVGDEGPAIEVRELLGAFPIPRKNVFWAEDDPWLRFRGIHSKVTEAFEQLCYECFQEKYFDESEYPNMPKNYPGVETIVTFSNKLGSIAGFQAKFFEDASASDAVAKIKQSVKNAIEQYNCQKGYLFVYSNKELNETNATFEEIRKLLKEHEIILKCSFGFALYKEIKDNYPKLEHDYFTPLGVD